MYTDAVLFLSNTSLSVVEGQMFNVCIVIELEEDLEIPLNITTGGCSV